MLGVGAAMGAAAESNAYAASGRHRGAIYPTLPAGCIYRPLPAAYECGGYWLRAAYGANGIYYRGVPAP